MKKILPVLLALALTACAFPALAYAPGDNILLPSGIPYGNYGYMGLIALYDGDMQQVDEHMRSAFSNQQGAGVSYQQRVVAGPTGPAREPVLGEKGKPYTLDALEGLPHNEFLALEDTLGGRVYFTMGNTLYYFLYGENTGTESHGMTAISSAHHASDDSFADFTGILE